MEGSIEILAKELQQEKRKNEFLRSVSLELGRISTVEEKLNNILELLDIQFNLKHTMLLFPDKKKEFLHVFASRGFEDSGIGTKIPFKQGIVGVVADRKKRLRVSRLSQYRRYASAHFQNHKSLENQTKLPHLVNAESQVALPLLANDELVAVLSCESENIQFFHQSDEDLLMTLSQQIALFIQNSILYEEMEVRVKDRTSELEKINETKDRLFSIIAHDLRSPVSALESVSELLEYYNKNGQQKKIAEIGPKIKYAAKNVNQLLDNLLNWSLSQQEGIQCNPQSLRLSSLIEEARELFIDLLESKNIDFKHDIDDNLFILADYNMAFSVFRNVISNSIKFTPAQGKVELTARAFINHVQINISDTGIGIDKDRIETLFTLHDKKSTLGTNRERGSGLGLVIVKEFMVLNNGSIELESSEKGTVVHLTFNKYL